MVAARRVVFVLYEGIQSLDLTGPWEVFESAVTRGAGSYELVAASLDGGPVTTSSGLSIGAQARLSEVTALDTLVVPGGFGTRAAVGDARLIGEIGRLSVGARRTAAVCSGSFLLGAAGLLDGRRAGHPLGLLRRARRRLPRGRGRRRPDLHPRRRHLHLGRGHGRHRPGAGPRRRGPRARARTRGRPLARRLRAAPRRAVAVLGPARSPRGLVRPVPRPPDLDRREPERGPLGPGARRPRPPLRAAARAPLPGRARRQPRRLRRAGPGRGGPLLARVREPRARGRRRSLRLRQRRGHATRLPAPARHEPERLPRALPPRAASPARLPDPTTPTRIKEMTRCR